MRIQHNVTAMNSYRNFNTNNSSLSKNLEKLSSGYKINRAGDDAAGLAISEKMRAQITGIEGATKNAKDGISLIQTAEGALTEVHSMLNRMTTLAEQSANGTYDNEVDRTQLQKEVESLKSEIDRVADSTNYNGIKLLDGSLAGAADAAESTVTGNVEGISLDATKAKSEIALNDFGGIGATDKFDTLDGMSVTLNMSLSDGSAKAITLNLVKNNNDLEIQSEDGKVLNKLTDADGQFDDAGAVKSFKDLITDSFRKAIKNDETLGSQFSASVVDTDTTANNGNDKLVLTAKNAGADGLTVTSADLTASKGTRTDGTTDADAAAKFNASNKAGATKSTTAIQPTVTKGTDAVTAFRAEDIVLYNDNYVDEKDGHKGNADKAVFEVNGVKFAIGTSNQTRVNLDADVHFISIKASDTAGTAEGGKGADGVGVTLKEYAGDTAAGGKDSTGTLNSASTDRNLNADALVQIANEIAKATGVEVNYNNTDYKTESTSTPKVEAWTFDGGEKLTSSQTHITAGKAVPMITIGKKASTEGRGLTLQIGDTSETFNKMTVSVADMHTKALNIADIDISTQEGASEAMQKIKDAINTVSDTRGGLGALQNRLDHTINNLGVMRENIQNAESLIRDTDVAEEMMTYTKNSILNQSAQSMLAQANQLPQGVMQLLQG